MDKSAFLREVRMIEFTNRWLWRFIRPLVKTRLSRRCDNCVIPESYNLIGEDGLCHDCRELPPQDSKESRSRSSPSKEITELLQKHSLHSSGTHDALVLISGGKDSSLLLHQLVTGFPDLRILTLLVDNGFMSPIALENAERVRAKFDVDHMTYRLRSSLVSKGFAFTLTQLDRQLGYSIVDLLDGTFTFDTARNLASQMDIPLILCGLSRMQAETVFGDDSFELPPGRELEAFEELSQTPLYEIFDEEEMGRFWDKSKYPEIDSPRFIMPFVASDPAETYILAEVERLGLLQADRTRPLLTNNALIPVIAIAEINQFGYTSFEVEFSQMIRGGKSDRIYWRNLFEMAEYSAKTGRFLSGSTMATLDQLGLSKEDVGLSF